MSRRTKYKVKKSVLILFVSFLLIGLASGCSGNDSQNNKKPAETSFVKHKKLGKKKKMPTGNNIWMKNLAFVPKIKVIKVGTTVTWYNKDVAMHTVHTGTPEKPLPMIASGTMGKGEKFSYTFKKKGTYKYFCTTHPTVMQGMIVVQ